MQAKEVGGVCGWKRQPKRQGVALSRVRYGRPIDGRDNVGGGLQGVVGGRGWP